MLFGRFLKKADPGSLNLLSLAGTIGLHLVSGVFVGAIFGYLLDKWLMTAPWCLAAGLFAGIIAGFKNVYVDAKRLLAAQDAAGPTGSGTRKTTAKPVAGKTPAKDIPEQDAASGRSAGLKTDARDDRKTSSHD